MARITYTESTPDQAQAAEILIPAIVVKDAGGNVCGTVALSLEQVTKRDAKSGEQVATGATRAMAAFTPARQGDRRFSARESHMRASVAALGPHLGYVILDTTEAGSIVIPQGANVVSTDDDGAVTHNWKAQKVTSS
jgi:hypothetical protein